MIYSFDIFDTLISRNTLTAKGIFALMRQTIKGNPVYPIALRTHFFNTRIRVEDHARKLAAKEEIKLEEIYSIIEKEHGLSSLVARELMELEERLEIENAYSVDEIVFRIKSLIAAGQRVILISDMYLPMKTVKAIVDRTAPELSSLPVYLSSEIELQKSRGSLFRYVLEKEGIKPWQLQHTGDNEVSDFQVPSRLGIKAELFTESHLTKLERTVIGGYSREYDITRQLAGGIARKMRLHLLRENRYTPVASFFGPILYGFIHDSLKRILASGKKRVYFISRDGRPLKLLADEIIAAYGYEMETQYVYGSRQAFRQAAILDPHYDLSWFDENFSRAKFSLRQLLERVDSDAEKLFSLLPGSVKSTVSLDASPGNNEIARIREAMVNHTPLREHIIETSRIKRRNALQYFRKSGLLGPVPYAIIDVGWSGHMQHCLYSILQSEDARIHLEEYYFALHDRVAGLESDINNRKHHYYIDLLLSDAFLFTVYLELFVQGDHGRCTGYNNYGEPVFSGDGQYLLDWGVREYYECLRIFAREYARASRMVLYEERFRHLSKDLEWHLLDPTMEMATLFGSLSFSEDQNDNLISEFAPALSLAEARAASNGELKLRWEAASYLRSSPGARRLLRRKSFRQKAKRAVKAVLDIYGITDEVKRLLQRLQR